MNRSLNFKTLTTVTLENIPSRNEVLLLLDTFLSDNKYPKDYNTGHKDNSLEIMFKNPEVAFEFVKRMTTEKKTNHVYNKIKISLGKQKKIDNKIHTIDTDRMKSNSLIRKNYESGCMKLYKNIIKRKKDRQSHHSISSSCSISATEPYYDKYQEMKKDIRDNKIKWVANRNFNGYIGKATYSKRHYLGGDTVNNINWEPFIFRKENKRKRLFQKDFIV